MELINGKYTMKNMPSDLNASGCRMKFEKGK